MEVTSVINENYALYNGDCVEVARQMPEGSVHFEIFSPPFANLYIYSDDLRDMGNCKNEDEFFTQFDYLIPELYRVLMRVDIPVGNTLPDMAATVIMCVAAKKIFAKKQ